MATVVSHNPVEHFVADDDDHRDWQPDPPVRDQSLTHARLAADLNQKPGSGDEQDEEPNDSHNRCGGHGSKAFQTQPVSQIAPSRVAKGSARVTGVLPAGRKTEFETGRGGVAESTERSGFV